MRTSLIALTCFSMVVFGCANAGGVDEGVNPTGHHHDSGLVGDDAANGGDTSVDDDTGAGGGDTGTNGDSATSGDTGTAGGDSGVADTGQDTFVQPTDVCGDGKVTGSEECDDSNTTDGDGCSSSCIVECPSLGKKDPTTHHCYVLSFDQLDWRTAKPACATNFGNGFHLATVTDATEDTLVASFGNGTWIGATDGLADDDGSWGTYAWVTGEAMTYTNWAPGEPNNNEHDCGFLGLGTCHYEHCMETYSDGTWNDADCRNSMSYVCERDPAGAP